ncbi:hypothetical protein J6590_038950 [Homalodisca vitripennis]|nr:hypothetical protein J6590_038950 [Homalodisca vitripennis]
MMIAEFQMRGRQLVEENYHQDYRRCAESSVLSTDLNYVTPMDNASEQGSHTSNAAQWKQLTSLMERKTYSNSTNYLKPGLNLRQIGEQRL